MCRCGTASWLHHFIPSLSSTASVQPPDAAEAMPKISLAILSGHVDAKRICIVGDLHVSVDISQRDCLLGALTLSNPCWMSVWSFARVSAACMLW